MTRTPKRRDVTARALADWRYRQRVKPNAKLYSRKQRHKRAHSSD